MWSVRSFVHPLLVRPPLIILSSSPNLHFYHRAPTSPLMAANKDPIETQTSPTNNVQFSPDVNKLQDFLHSNPFDGWEKCWEEGVTPWDMGKPTPILQHLLQTDSLPKGRALVPGCGGGYDVVALASPERYVVGLDLSETAIGKARELASSSPNVNYISFLQEDFFSWKTTQLFDLIFDYTFFCAIQPKLRPAWAARMRDLLKPDGELITLMFPIDDHEGGPPYKACVSDYEEVLHPLGFHAVSIVENELAVAPRKGREKLGRWRRVERGSHL